MRIKHYLYNSFVIESGDNKIAISCHYNASFLWIKNAAPADDRAFKREVEKQGVKCRIMNYGDEIESGPKERTC